MNMTTSAITAFLMNIPLYIVLLVGMGMAVVNWGKSPKVSVLSIAALAVGLGVALAGPASSFLMDSLHRNGTSWEQVSYMEVGINLVLRLCQAVSWILILVALSISLRLQRR
jgi:cobalamin biosynthesis protein CobD/CbiB